MQKRIYALGLAAVMLFLSGCSSIFQKEYLSITKYTEEEHNEYWNSAVEVTSYEELKSEIYNMVQDHVEQERLNFSTYEGDLNEDFIRGELSRAFREIQNETALGSYAVLHFSHYDLIQIITRYEVTVYINYRRTQEEVAEIGYVSGKLRLPSFLTEMLSGLETNSCFRMNVSELNESEILSVLRNAFENNPISCVFLPEATVTIHPTAGPEFIIELELGYPKSNMIISNMRQALTLELESLVKQVQAENEQTTALQAYNTLAASVHYDPTGEIRRGNDNLDPTLGNSIYGALVDGCADSYGIALAYSALCREVGIECLVVTGTLNKLEHSWNLIRLGDSFHHVDVSADTILGISGAFGRSDSQMNGYWWFIEDYPEATSSLNAEDIFSPNA